ncbi:MAG: PEGA domain-containing protein, partial [Sandaracinus sp.]|nr:PEGA domain-containing protein [Sandaracinus sp.]
LDPEWRDWRASLKAFDRDPRSSTFPLATPVSQVTRKSTEQPLDPPAAAGPTQKVSSYKLDDDEDTEEDVTALAFRPKAVRDAIRQPPSVTPEPVDFGLDDAVEAKPPQKMRWVVAAVAAALGLGAATWVFTGDDETPAAATSPTNAAPTDETPEPEAPEPAQPVTTTSVPVAPTTPSVEEAPVEETPSVTPESPPEEATGTLPSGTSSLLVQTRPIGARVRIDGVLLPGTTPFRFTELPEGRHRVSIELPGHRPRQQWVRLRPGRGGVIRARLRAAR